MRSSDGGGDERETRGGPARDDRRLVVLLIAAVSIPSIAAAAEPVCASPEGEPVWAERVVRGDEIVLVDGRRVRLAGVEAPRPPFIGGERASREAADVDAAARAALADRVEGREIALTETGTDRHGRRLGHLYDTERGQWIEAELVAAGHLRVTPSRVDRGCAAALLAEERAAMDARRGLWAMSAFAVVPAEAGDLVSRVGRWAVVEGRVRSIGRSGGHIWLNFGEDFRRDFAVVMDDKDLEGFRAAGFDATAARGWTVRVRGVVTHRGGPRIAVEVPENIERVRR
ncbi:thermonuclease family protein [Pinisolibacter sp.]|uniref:thermonuclease family protein n=1 Tax=Pinisolibacter sp. TaxID=2172024 RepID=UPI002FDE59A2